MEIRTLVILIETQVKGDELLAPYITKALREYADDLETGKHGNTDPEQLIYCNGRVTIKTVHGWDWREA